MKNICLLLGLMILLSLSFVSAEYLSQKQNNPLDVIITSNNATSCNITAIEYTNKPSNLTNLEMNKSGQTFNYTLNESFFNSIGDICINIVCTDGLIFENGNICRSVTPSGQSNISEGQGMTILGSMAIIVLVGIVFFVLFFKTENLGLKTVWGGLAVVDLVIAILFSIVTLTQVVGGFDNLINGFTTFWFVIRILLMIGLVAFILFAFYLSFKLWQFKRGYLN